MRCGKSFLLCLCLAGIGCERKAAAPRKNTALQDHNLLLITLDTTRANRIGCYGYTSAATPALDALAASGTLFEQAFSAVPMTLPSHSVMMAGRYPRELGIRTNDKNILDPSYPTLASLFKEKGYRTGAFVSTFVLDSRFGLEKGFDIYEDDMGKQPRDLQKLKWERSADRTTDRALHWLGEHSDKPFFAWVHYYDPHDPYKPPPAFRAAHPLPYDGEIAFMDTQIKRLMDWLNQTKRTGRTLVVVVGDHGESFGEHVERGHTDFLYETNLHVPLLFAHPGVIPAGKRISATVETAGLLPTILDLYGWPSPEGLLTTSLATAFTDKGIQPMECFSESNAVFAAYQWAEQRSLTTPDWKYISSTRPELYDRKADAEERHNVLAEHPDIGKRFREALLLRYEAMVPQAAATTTLDTAALEKLRSLGYAAGVSSHSPDHFLTPDLPDPKDMQPVAGALARARKFILDEKYDDAIPLLEGAVRTSPKSLVFHYTLGTCYVAAKRYDEALVEFDAAAKTDPEYGPIYLSKGDAYAGLKKFDEAIKYYDLALEFDDDDADVYAKFASALNQMHQTDKAIRYYREALKLQPDYPEVHFELGIIFADQGKLPEAIQQYQKAVELKPDDVQSRYNLGVSLLRTGNLSEAATQLQEVVRLKPDDGKALNNLGIALARQKHFDEAERALRQAMQVEGSAAEANYNLGVTKLNQNQVPDAVSLLEKALELNPVYEHACQKLVGIYLANGMTSEALRVLRPIVPKVPNNATLANIMADILATSREDTLRDGPQAVTLAERASRLTAGHNSKVLQTLAAAYAEAGHFRQAVETAEKAVALAQAAGPQELTSRIQSQLKGYRANQPYRNPQY